jgi:hypothetical protein
LLFVFATGTPQFFRVELADLSRFLESEYSKSAAQGRMTVALWAMLGLKAHFFERFDAAMKGPLFHAAAGFGVLDRDLNASTSW